MNIDVAAIKNKSLSLYGKLPAVVRKRIVWFIGGGVAAALLLLWMAMPNGNDTPAAFYEAKRGDLLVSVVEGGTLEALNEVVVRSEVEGTARIIYIVPEGTYVKKGDLLAELDSSQAQDQVNQQLINYEKASFALIQAKEQYTIQKSAVESDIRAAELKLEFAQTDLRKFLEGQASQQRRNLEIEIANVKENLLLAKERLGWSEKLYEQGFETKSNLDKDRLAVSQTSMKLEQAEKALWMYETFDFPKTRRQYEADVDHNTKELERVKLQGERKLAQSEADVRTQESTTELSRKKLERDQKNLAACRIYAPQDGLVVYATSGNRWSSESLIEEGATVRNRQEIIKLPDIAQMKLTVKVHESYVTMIKPGQAAFVVLDALPDKRFRGHVRRVSLLPDTQSRYANPNLKLYATEILITDPLPDIKPGVSARAEIIVANLEDVLTVPLQAVTTRQGHPVVYVSGLRGPKAVPVELGMYNTKYIQIIAGLKAGDRVLLAPPLDTQEKDLGGNILTLEEVKTLPAAPPTPAPAATAPAAAVPPPAPIAPDAPASAAAPTAQPSSADAGKAPRASPFNREEFMKRFDTDGDGQLSEPEQEAMRAAFRERFGSQESPRPRRGQAPAAPASENP